MTATEPTTSDEVQYRPHRAWYRRTDVVVPLILVALGYTMLIVAVEEKSFFRTRLTAKGSENFDWMYFWHLVPLMWQGLQVLAKATVLGFTIAAVLGLLLALGRRSGNRFVRWPFVAFIEFIRSTPLLVQLFFAQAYVRASDSLSWSPITILVVVLGIHYATYCSEAYRAGINSVPPGQWEAATALNLGSTTKWLRVILPQAIPNVLPSLGNFLVAAFKDAPLGFIVGVPELLFFANTVRGSDFRPTEPYILAGVGFLLVSIPAAWAVRRLERKIAYERT
ncbi:ectoine/hydroxyectoine ABC transporter permease subunit EhuD [Acidimicrobiia bacterium EGI L10123]|uniref:ectoine/hydroxyectoine ABC transporter permease subunit EhuD n=1 Tax=Salinilacustrithrix flava TaxID=2957203 RepID=UPI003D7C33F9|nr:ectoine/hydroxyectoine ABC transporter permease subunit EhuD [Acidimicrobiia bacterium EGI L10123]